MMATGGRVRLSRLHRAFLCRRFIRRALLAPLDEIENRGEIEKPRAFYLSRLADGHGADRVRACQFVKFCAAESAVKFRAALGTSYPARQSAVAVLE